jgi:hypothetical protein
VLDEEPAFEPHTRESGSYCWPSGGATQMRCFGSPTISIAAANSPHRGPSGAASWRGSISRRANARGAVPRPRWALHYLRPCARDLLDTGAWSTGYRAHFLCLSAAGRV